MKKLLHLILLFVGLLCIDNLYAQINTPSTCAVPFGKNTAYKYGIMPTNLPTSGTYTGATAAGAAYTAWKSAYVTTGGSGEYRVLFDDGSSTVSEGIAYGMLLSVYAADKTLFDGLWTYYKNHRDGNGVMNWKYSSSSSVTGSNGATDAELDVAMALIIAAEQWSSTAGNTYKADALSLIQKIKSLEMATDGQTLNGDAWGNTNSCRNPSYFAPGYYTEFAKVDASNATFWNTTAITATNTILTANRNSTSGLVSNWCDNSGTENSCGNTGSGASGFGADACRNPWRMAIDYLWHGSSASTVAKDIDAKLTSFVNGYEGQLKGPLTTRSVSNPSSGSYINGSYATFALPPMTSSSAQLSLNRCYTNVAALSNVDAYFNSTIRCISMFVLTGNFWAPGASGFVFPPTIASAVTDATGKIITLTANKALTTSTPAASAFTVYYNGTAQTGIVSSVSVSGSTITVNVSTAPTPGQTVTISYSGTSITSTDAAVLATFTNMTVLNMLAGNETILDDCDDGNSINNVGGIWFSFNDAPDQKAACKSGTTSTISPLSSASNPFKMTAPGYNSTAYAVNATYTLGANYTPYNSGSCASWTNPAYVGIGTWCNRVQSVSMDWSSGTGVSFWYKGPACAFQVIISEVTDYAFHAYAVPACTAWTKLTLTWDQFVQPGWTKSPVTFSAKHVQKLQWQFATGTTGAAASTGSIWIDDVHVLNMPPVPMTSMAIGVDPLSKITDPLNLTTTSTDTLKLQVVPTPTTASYPVASWSSSDTTVVKIDYNGYIKVIGYGTAIITARSKMQQNLTATYTVTVPAPKVNPTAIAFSPTTYSVGIGSTTTLIPTFTPTNVNQTGLTWTSSNALVASVSASGVVTGVAVGTVTITATSTTVTSIKATATVSVVKTDVTGLTVTPTSVTVTLGESATITPTITPTNATNQTVNWTSSNLNIATVNSSGVISSVGVGTCTITATSADNSAKTATISVTVNAIAVSGVSVTPTSTSVVVGATTTLTPTVSPSTAAQTVTYTTSDKTIATVSTAGVVTGVAVGTATITVASTSDATKTATCVITVNPVLVTAITVAPTTASLYINETTTLSASVAPTNPTIGTYTWSSSNAAVATVDATGKVTAVATGTANIIATANDASGKTGICVVTVSPRLVTGITMSPTTLTLNTTQTSTLTATVAPINATLSTVKWTSSDETVATVDGNGKVSAIKIGTATITASANDASGKSATCLVTVSAKKVTTITVTATATALYMNETATVTASVVPTDATDKTVTWSSDNTNFATVTSDGTVTAVAAGTVTITATANDGSGVTGTILITVSPRLVTSITMSPTTATLYVNDNTTLTASVAPSNATLTTVKWSSSDETVATVDANGKVTANKIGTATITASANDASGKSATCVITVAPRLVTSITMSSTTATLYVNDNASLTATVAPINATLTSVKWTSSDETVATVDANGKVTANKIGTATITASANDASGKTATCAITVAPRLVTNILVTPTATTLNIGDSTTLTATVSPTNATDGTYTWSSSNKAIATVDASGKVIGIAEGTATITALANDASGKSATCLVTINAVLPISVSTSAAIGFVTTDPSQTLTATIFPTNTTDKTITWTSSNINVATVNAKTGEVTPVGIGSCTITVSCNAATSVNASCVVTVAASVTKVTGITLDNSTLTITIGSTGTLTATVAPANATDKSVNWISSDPTIATVANGLISGLKIGTATITVTTVDGSYKASCTVTVGAVSVTGVTLDQTALLLNETSNPVQLTATVAPSNATERSVSWSSSNTAVASVSSSGVVSVQGIGTATITVTTTDGSKTAICNVTVSATSVTGVTLDQTSLPLTASSNSVTLTATVLPANATNKGVSWSSSNNSVVTVTNGVVSVTGIGTATITVTTTDGSKTATCNVTVSSIAVTGISLDKTSLSLAATSTPVTLMATISPINATIKDIAWLSSNTKVATVSSTGVVSVQGIGTATITVTTADGSKTAICNVTVSAINVTQITLDQTSLALTLTSTPIALTPTISPADASDKSVKWTSSDPTIATVANGVVSAAGIGTATITATANDGSGITTTCLVTVSSIAVKGITLDQTSLSATVTSNPVTLIATINPTDATDRTVSWTSSNSNIAMVSTSGVVSFKGIGTATITVTTTDGSKTATCNVTVNAISVTSITLDQPTLAMTVASSPVTLTPTINPIDASDKSVTWLSSNTKIATVNASGIVTAISVGTATITVTANDGSGISGTCIVTVNAIPVTGVTLDKSTLTLNPGGVTGVLTATVSPENATDKSVTWSSSNIAIATVDKGIVTPVSVGTATITVTTTDGSKTASCVVKVEVNTISVTGITLVASKSVALNESLTLTATVAPSNATVKDITWSSSDVTVATVDASGILTLLKVGTTTITATTVDGGKTASCAVTVTKILTSSIIIDNAADIIVGNTKQLTAQVSPTGANTSVTWHSDNTSIATVDGNGLISTIAAGSANVTATATDGTGIISNTCVVTVTTIPVTGVVLNSTSLIIDLAASTSTLTATVQPTNATNKNVTWLASNTSIITVSNGLITAVALGTATVTATSAERSVLYAKCTIEVVTKETLKSTITKVQKGLDTAITGTAIGDYPESAKTILQAAIDTAQGVVKSSTATQAQIDAAVATLLKAQSDFNKKQIVNETLIFNAELANLTFLNTYWYSFNDATPGGSSKVTPLTDASHPFTMSQPGANGTANAAMIDYSLMGATALGYSPFVGMGLQMKDPAGAYDLTGSTGMSFWVKSQNPYYLEINLTSITDDGNYYILLPAATNWTKVTLNWSDFAQYSWGVKKTWDLTLVSKFQWKVQSSDGTAGQLWVDEVKILGKILDLPKLNLVDRTALDSLIKKAQTVYSTSVEGYAEGQYQTGSKTTLLTSITSAQSALDTCSTQAGVDQAVIDLKTAINLFQTKIIHIDLKALNAAIGNAQAIHDAAFEGVANGQYPSGSKATLQFAINTASSASLNTLSTQANIDQATTTLVAAVASFKAKIITIDLSKLKSLISSAQTTYSNAVVGTLDGQYPAKAKTDFLTAITTAQTASTNASISQAQVDQAKTDLQTAIDIFLGQVNTSVPVDKTALNTKITTANSLDSAAIEGTKTGQYPTGAKQILETAISLAKSVYADPSAIQGQVNTATINLQTAITQFLAKQITVDRTVLAQTITNAQTILLQAVEGTKPGQYPAFAISDLNTALATAQGVYDSKTSTQSEIDAANTALINAIADFESRKVDNPDKNTLYQDIVTAQGIIATAKEGDRPTQYPSADFTAFKTAINTAFAVYNDPTQNQSDVNAADDALDAAKSAFYASQIQLADTKSLADKIVAANNIISRATIGTRPSQYPQWAKDTLATVILQSENVKDSITATQDEINKQITILDNAITAFQNSIYPEASRKTLNTEIENAKASLNGIRVPEDYPQSAVDSLTSAINAANDINSDPSATLDEVNASATLLESKIQAFTSQKVGFDNVSISTTFGPNPVVDVLHIYSTETIHSYEIYSVIGKSVKHGTATEVDLNDLTSGNYFIKVILNNGSTIVKLISKE